MAENDLRGPVAKGATITEGKAFTASVRYLSSDAHPSIIQNRKCYTKRGLDGSDATFVGCDSDIKEVQVADARVLIGTEQQPSLAKEGFELRNDFNLGAGSVDFLDHDSVVRNYYPQVAAFIKRATGAREVFPFDHNVRSTQSAAAKGSSQVQVQPPLGQNYGVHTDYTVTSGARRLVLLTAPPKLNDALRAHVEAEGRQSVIPAQFLSPLSSEEEDGGDGREGGQEDEGADVERKKGSRAAAAPPQVAASAAATPSPTPARGGGGGGGGESGAFVPRRMAMFNVWRSIAPRAPVRQMPLALCAADSVQWDRDLVVFEIHYQDRIGENFFAKWNEQHRWYYFPEMTSEECLLFKQWDSWGRVNVEAVRKLREKLSSLDSLSSSAPLSSADSAAVLSSLGLEGVSREEQERILEDVKLVLAQTERFNFPVDTDGTSSSSLPVDPNGFARRVAKEDTAKDTYHGKSQIGGVNSSTFCLHSAVELPTPGGLDSSQIPPRESIEVRCFAFY